MEQAEGMKVKTKIKKLISKNFRVGQNIWRVTSFIKSFLSPSLPILTMTLTVKIIITAILQMKRKPRFIGDTRLAKYLMRHED